jgi:hypothetical protein
MIQKITIGTNTYSKSSLGKAWSEIVAKHVLGVRLSGEDLKFVDACVSLVPKWQKILNRGHNYFYKIGSKKFRNKYVNGIMLVTPNSAKEVWIGKGQLLNYLFPKKSSSSEPEFSRSKVLQALRLIVQPQIDMYRRSIHRQLKSGLRYKIRCAITHETLNFGEFHIDHKYPFKNLVEDWCKKYSLDLEKIPVYCKGTRCYLKNTEIAESFFDYHMIYAELQPTTSKANLAKGSKIT